VDELEPPLTSREVEILHWVAAGLPNKDVAHQLGISLATVRNHIHSILEKLEVHSKLEAVSLAFRRGWVSGQPEDEEVLVEA
jgi:DNA-binding NarL/FixJ family response regulator